MKKQQADRTSSTPNASPRARARPRSKNAVASSKQTPPPPSRTQPSCPPPRSTTLCRSVETLAKNTTKATSRLSISPRPFLRCSKAYSPPHSSYSFSYSSLPSPDSISRPSPSPRLSKRRPRKRPTPSAAYSTNAARATHNLLSAINAVPRSAPSQPRCEFSKTLSTTNKCPRLAKFSRQTTDMSGAAATRRRSRGWRACTELYREFNRDREAGVAEFSRAARPLRICMISINAGTKKWAPLLLPRAGSRAARFWKSSRKRD